MPTTRTWSATESRIVEPYFRSTNALTSVRFRMNPSEPFSSEPVYWLDPEEIPQPFLPELELVLDGHALIHEARIPTDDLRLAVVLRDRASHRWEKVDEFAFESIPGTYQVDPDTLERFAVGRRLETAVLIVPRYGLPPMQGRAHLPQHVVAERSFAVNLKREGNSFPVRVRDQKWFEEHNFPAETVWTIDWVQPDPYQAPMDVLNVVVNEAYAQRLQRALGLSDSSDGGLGHQIASEVFTEVALFSLREADDWPDDPECLLGMVLGSLGARGPQDLERLKNLVADSTDALALLRGRGQAALGLGKALGRS